LKLTQVNLEDLNTATLRLYEDHETSKARLNEDRESLKKAHSHVKQVHSRVHTIGSDLQATREKLDMHANLVDLQTVTEGNDRANSTIVDLKSKIDEVGATADAVKEGLKESNELLLPNIHLASPTARRTAFRHGSLMMTSTLKGNLGMQNNSSTEQRIGGESARHNSSSGETPWPGTEGRQQQSGRPTTAPLIAAGPIPPQGPA